MHLVRTITEVRECMAGWHLAGRQVALVPTMGNLHRGHLALVANAARHAEKVAVSIFVNPLQFDDARDLSDYPRSLETDLELLRAQGVALVFIPTCEEIYPSDYDHGIRVDPGDISTILCGVDRPEHFAGVATVVVKLFNIFQPDTAVFGEKDYQQLILVRRLTRYLNFNTRVVAVSTVREASGLALSSRNNYLDPEQKQRAAVLYQVLRATAMTLRGSNEAGEAQCLIDAAYAEIESAGLKPDYVELRDLHTLEPFGSKEWLSGSWIILGAVRVGKARLIDNVIVDETSPVVSGQAVLE